jgi:hypothetical protein
MAALSCVMRSTSVTAALISSRPLACSAAEVAMASTLWSISATKLADLLQRAAGLADEPHAFAHLACWNW